MDFAIIQTGGKQYKGSAGEKLKVEKLDGEAGSEIILDRVLLVSQGGKVEVGTPYLAKKVVAKIIQEGRDKKKLIFKYHSKTRLRKRKGHRQTFTEIEIAKI